MKRQLLVGLVAFGILLCLYPVSFATCGSLVGWGDNSIGQNNVPAGTNFTAIAAGYEYSLALKSDGSLVAWGSNAYGLTSVPAGNNFTAIAAGYEHSLALRSDGSLVAWGGNWHGQCNVPAGNNFTAIAAGGYHNLAIQQIPEPTTLLLLGLGGLALLRKRRLVN